MSARVIIRLVTLAICVVALSVAAVCGPCVARAGLYVSPQPLIGDISCNGTTCTVSTITGTGNVASAGAIRLLNNVAIEARTQANSANIILVQSDTSNNALFGDSSNTNGAYLTAASSVNLRVGGNTTYVGLTTSKLSIGQPVGGISTTPFAWSATATPISCSTGGTQTISSAQAITPGLAVTSGTLSSDCTLDFSTNAATGWYQVDVSGSITLNGHNLVFKNGTQSQTYSSVPSKGLITVYTHGANTCVTAP